MPLLDLLSRFTLGLIPAHGPSYQACALVDRIAEIAGSHRMSTDAQLQSLATELGVELRRQDKARDQPDYIACALALYFEGVRRVHGLELFSTQLLAGALLASGKLVELQTGEGKTLAAGGPALLHGLVGNGAHVVTPNAYLATRDFELVAPVLRLLGCTAGLLREHDPPATKRIAYDCDVTYGTGYEFGFDYLREHLTRLAQRRAGLGAQYHRVLQGLSDAAATFHPRRGFAIIDEVDSVLIDEACTPLVLSDEGVAGLHDDGLYREALALAELLEPECDYQFDAHLHGVALTERGRLRCYRTRTASDSNGLQRPWSQYVQQALHAKFMLTRDVDYVVRDGKILIVDGTTGRICPDRSWRDGLHQLLEAKEGLGCSRELQSAARITRQRYFRLYDRLAGMSGTAVDSQREFQKTYGLPVVMVESRNPPLRVMLPPRYFIDLDSKWRAVVQATSELHATGRPILIGSRTIENSETLSRRMTTAGIPHQVLNGKQTVDEAHVIAHAGQVGAVTIATNMAGRGTDIKLGPGAAERGGLHLLAIELNDSQRVDRQLIGRVGRQGDPGSFQFFVSADDALLCRYGQELAARMKQSPHFEGELREDISKALRAVQGRAESAGYRQRQELAASDRWMTEELNDLVR